jgi:hypothetical protein
MEIAAAAEKRDAGDPYAVIHKDIDTALQQIVEVLKEKGVGVLTSRNEDFPQPTREHQAAGLAHVKVMTLVDSRGHISETLPSAIKYAHEHPDESVAFRHNDFVIDVAPDAKAEDLFRAFQRLDAQKRSRPSLGR